MPTAQEVREVLTTDYGANKAAALTRAIAASTTLVARLVACAADKGTPLTDDEQANIAVYLAAHFYCVSDRLYTSRNTAGVSGSWSMAGLEGGLRSTPYGQTALTLDPSGCLTAQDKRQTADAFSCGPDDES